MRHLPLPSLRHSLGTAAAFMVVTAVMLAVQDHLVLIDVVLAYYALAIVIAFVLGRRAAAVVVVLAPVASVLLLQLTAVGPNFGTGAAYARAAAITIIGAGALYAMPRWLTGADELRRLSQTLRERTQTLETLANSAPVAIMTVDVHGTVTSWNPAAERMFGWLESEIVGRQLHEVSPENREATLPLERAVLEEGQSVRQLSTKRFSKDGRVMDLSVSAAPLRDAAEKVRGVVVVCEDITEQLAAAEALRARTNALETLARSAPVAIVTLDSGGAITSWNPAAEQIYGWQEAEVLGRRIIDVSAENATATPKMLDEVLGEGASFQQVEVKRVRKDGRWIDVSMSVAPLRGASGDVNGLVAVAVDVTARKAADDALRRADELRASVMESTSDAIFAMGLDRHFTLVNKRACEITGYTQEELLGHTPTLFFSPEMDERSRAQFRQALESAQPTAGYEVDIIRKGGAPGTIRVSLTPLMDGGKVTGIVGTAEDVTERKRLEEQFLQSQKMESIGRLAGGVAHDFNNLMTAIIGYADLSLAALDPADPVAADVNDIRATADRAAKLAHQLLAFSRRQMIEPRVVDMNELIVSAHSMLRRLIGENIELVTQAAPDLKPVKVDPTQFTQVVVNLAVNARDAMPAGGTLTLATANVELDGRLAAQLACAAGPYVRLTVTDTGSGMTEDVLQHLFEPFFTTKETGKGTGLGLATCYGIVKQAGGSILGCSEPGAGSTFAVYLPAATEPVEAVVEVDVPALPPGHETILLAEDERPVHKVAARVLRELGYTVLSAVDGGEALRIAEQYGGPIDLLITDVVMPGMNGKELAERVTRQRPSIRVLLTSGYADDELVRHDPVAQAAAFLPKPFSPQTLASRVREVLDGAR